jgi:hypothetical protein
VSILQTVQVLDPLNLGRVNNAIPTLGITGNLPTFAVDIALLLYSSSQDRARVHLDRLGSP